MIITLKLFKNNKLLYYYAMHKKICKGNNCLKKKEKKIQCYNLLIKINTFGIF